MATGSREKSSCEVMNCKGCRRSRPDGGRLLSRRVSLWPLTCRESPSPERVEEELVLPIVASGGHGRPSTQLIESRQRPRAGAELVGLDAQPLQHAHVQVAQRRRLLRVEGQVLAVLEAAAGQQDRHVLDAVRCWRRPGCC